MGGSEAVGVGSEWKQILFWIWGNMTIGHLSNSTCINPVLEKGEAVLGASMPENTGQLYSFRETCGFSAEIYFKLPKHFRVALMTEQGLYRTAVHKQKQLCKHENCSDKRTVSSPLQSGRSSCWNPCWPGQLNTSQWPLEHEDQPCFFCSRMPLAPYTFQSLLGNVHLFLWVFRSRCSVLTNLQWHHQNLALRLVRFISPILLSNRALKKIQSGLGFRDFSFGCCPWTRHQNFSGKNEWLWWTCGCCPWGKLRTSPNIVNAFKPYHCRKSQLFHCSDRSFLWSVSELSPGLYYLQRRLLSQFQILAFKIYPNWFPHSPGCHSHQAVWNKSHPGAAQVAIPGSAHAESWSWSHSSQLQPLPWSFCPGRKWDFRLVGYITPWLTPLQCSLHLQEFKSTETSSPTVGAGRAEQDGRRDGSTRTAQGPPGWWRLLPGEDRAGMSTLDYPWLVVELSSAFLHIQQMLQMMESQTGLGWKGP